MTGRGGSPVGPRPATRSTEHAAPVRWCECARPLVFRDPPANGAHDASVSCYTCGRPVPVPGTTASTARLALAIAEVVIGGRRLRS